MHYSNKKFSLKIIYSLSFVLFFTSVKLIAQPLTVDGGLHQTICLGSSTAVGGSPTANYGTPGYTYSWAPAAGLSSTIVSNPTANPTSTTTYTITVTDAVAAVATATVTITVDPLPVISPVPANVTVCNGTFQGSTTFSSLPGGATINWTNSNPSIGIAPSGVGFIPSFTATNTGTTPQVATITLTPTLAGCTGPSSMYTITVNPTPVGTSSPSSDIRCSGVNSNFVLNSSVIGTTYNWTTSGTGVSGNTSSSGSVISQSVTATTTSPGNANYIITPTAAGCVGTTFNATLTVNPIPVATATTSSLTRCSGDTVSFSVSSDVAGTTFSWITSISNASGADASGTGNSVFDTLTATTLAPGTVVYIFTPVAAGCSGSQAFPFVTVNPIPVVTATPSSPVICSGDNTSITLSSLVSGTTYTWTSSMVSNVTGESASGTSASINDVLNCTFAAAGSLTYQIIPTAAGCIGPQLNTSVIVNPLPTMTAFPSTYPAICSGGLVSVTFNSSPGGGTFSWTSTEFNTSGSALSGTGNLSEFLSAAPSAGTTTYTVTPMLSGCAGTPLIYPINVNPTPNAVFSLPSSGCELSSNIFPSLTGTSGVWSATPAGLVIDPSTAEIDLTASTPGTYDVTNTIAAAGGCPATSSTYTGFPIYAYLDPTITNVTSVCYSDAPFNFVAASTGGTWSGVGITNSTLGTFDPAPAGLGTYTITYTTPGSSCINIDTTVITVTAADLYGKVTYSGGDLTSGTNNVVLFNYSSTFATFDTAQVCTVDALGYYHFTNVYPGDYLIEVYADTLVYPLAIPTYYDSEFLWDTALVKNHGCSVDTADIYLIEGIVTSGPGSISGFVTEGAGFVRSPGDPIPGLDVKLGKNPGGAMITNTQTTSPLGAYGFSNLAINSPGEYYTVYVDIPGLQRDSVWNITVTATNTVFTNINYIADSNSVYPFFPSTASIVSAEIENSLTVFPNPTNASTTIEYTLTSSSAVKLEVVDVLGKQLESLVNTNQSAGSYKVNLAKLNTGIYFIRLNINNQTNTTRLVVTD